MKLFYLKLKNLPPALQVLLRPMLIISLGLHGLFLMLPMLPESKPKTVPPNKEEKVKITRLAASPTQPSPKLPVTEQSTPIPNRVTPPPVPKSTPLPTAPEPTKTSLPEKQEEKQPKETQEEEPKETQEKQPKEIQQEEQQAKKTPQEEPKETQQEEQQPKETQQDNSATAGAEAGGDLLKELRKRVLRDLVENSTNEQSTVEEFLDSLPIAIEEMSEDKQPYFFAGNKLKVGAEGSLGISQRSPQKAYEQYIEPILKNELGFNIEPQNEQYGEADLYKAQNNEGVEFYMSLVPLSSFNTQTLVVIWSKDPRKK